MATYLKKTPGVYVEELSLLPPSVVEVSTAIPAFIGHTETGHDLPPTRITSMLEYEQTFGGPRLAEYEVTVGADGVLAVVQTNEANAAKFLMYHQVRMFYANGGGICYIVPTGNYSAEPTAASVGAGLTALDKEDEPTIIVFPDAPALPNSGTGANAKPGSFALYEGALAQCKAKKDRFTLMDLKFSDVTTFRDKGPASDLNYGAAYTPYLETAAPVSFKDSSVTVKQAGGTGDPSKLDTLKNGATNALYNKIKNRLNQNTLTLPPSGAIAGVYSRVDRERGVWKAPANVGVSGINGPAEKISDLQQENLNVHDSGKSINAIRSFPGKGTLVWGARTLDGNSNEWRYVNVRRLFIMMEESIQKATAFAVFEPNTPSTWLKVKAMVESFLFTLWQRGALAGTEPKQAYFVQVGLGITMTEDDINNGYMIVKVGVAAARPAEFIILEFSHKMLTA